MLYTKSRNQVWGVLVSLLLLAGVLSVPASAQPAGDPVTRILVLGGPAAVSNAAVDQLRGHADIITVLAGPDRYATAAEISGRAFPDEAPVVFIATGEGFADALAVGPWAARSGGPILLTRPEDLPEATATEIERLAPARIVVVGGTGAVSDAVEESLSAFAPVERIAGRSRVETAVAVAQASHPDGAAEVAIARADDFADALTAGPLVTARDGVILLSDTDQLPDATRAELLRLAPQRITVLGGTSAISANVEADLSNLADAVERLAGATRFETAEAIARALFGRGETDVAYVASGRSFADALAGAAIAVRPAADGFAQGGSPVGGPILLVEPDSTPPSVLDLLDFWLFDFGDPADNQPPTVSDLTATTDEDTPVEITLDGSDPDGDALTYALGDLPTDADVTLDGDVVTFDPLGVAGTRTFTYTASDGTTDSAPATVTVEVDAVAGPPANRAPVVDPVAVTTDEDTPVVITLVGRDADGDALTYTADPAGQGTVVPGPAADQVTYTPDPDTNGADSFTYTASDGRRDSAPATVDITITPVPDAPVAIDGSGTTDEDVDLVASVSGTDADGDALVFAVDTAPTAGSLTAFDVNTGAFTYTPTPNVNGVDSFTFTVDDGSGPTAPATFDITITPVDDAPIANDDTATTNEDTPAGGTVTATSVDGGTVTFALDSDASNGTATVAAGGAFTYTPDADFNGPDSFTFSATEDGLSSTGTISVTVTPVPDAPTADDQTLTTDEDQSVSGTLTGGDVDGDTITFAIDPADARVTALDANTGDFTFTPDLNSNGTQTFTFRTNDGALDSALATVTVTVDPVQDAPVADARTAGVNEDDSVVIALSGSDPDGDPLTFAIDSPPTNGALGTVVSTGATTATVEYTPTANYTGPDSFTFTVDDGTVASAPATVSITVSNVNDPPTVDDVSDTTDEDVAVTLTLTGGDIDGDPLTFSVVSGPGDGTLGAITSTGPTTAQVTYTPDGNFNGSDSFTVKSNDGTVDSSANATISITVDPVNDPPTATAGSETVDEDDSVVITLSGTDVDTTDLTFAIVSGPTSGSLSGISGNGAGQTATVTYTPTADYNGGDSFTFTVNDGTTTSAAATVSVTVDPVEDQPTATAGSETVDEDDSVVITLAGTDVDGDALTFAISAGPTSGGLSGISGNGVGQTATVTYTPTADYNGPDSFDFTVNDGTTTSAAATVSITVNAVNDPPAAVDETYDAFGNTELIVVTDLTEPTPVLRGPGVRIQGTVVGNDTDGDGDTLTATAASGQATAQGGAVDIQADGTFVYTPAVGSTTTDTFTYTVTDGAANDTGTVTINLSNMIWYVDADADAGGDGRSHTPFDTMPATVGGTGDIIHVGESASPTGGAGITLLDDQKLIGAGVALEVGTPAVQLLPAATAPVVTSSADGITLGTDNTVRGLDIGSTSGIGLVGNTGFGTLAMSDVTFSGTGRAISLIGGTMGTLPAGDRHIDSIDVVLAGAGDRAIHTNQVGGTLFLGTVDVTGTGNGPRFVDTGATTDAVVIDSLDVDVTGIALQAQNLSALTITNGTAGQERLHSSGDQAIDITAIPSVALTTDSVSSSNASAPGIDITSTGGSFTVEGTTTVTNNAATAVDIDSGPTTTFGGLVQASGVGGLQLTGGATTLSALGGLQATGTSGMGLDVGNGTTINVAGVGSTASSGTNTAVHILGTIGGVGVTFDSVSTNGGTDGIVLVNTGAGTFTVTGGTGNDGGTIQGVANDGISLTNVGGLVSLDDLTITNAGRHGINATGGGAVTLNSTTITNPGNASDEHGIRLVDTGAVTITDPTVTNSADTAILVERTTTSGTVTITDSDPDVDIQTVGNAGSAVMLRAVGTTATIPTGTITGLDIDGVSGYGVHLQAGDDVVPRAGTIGTQGATGTNSTESFVIDDITIGSLSPFTAGSQREGVFVEFLELGRGDVNVINSEVVVNSASPLAVVSSGDADGVVEFNSNTVAVDNPVGNQTGIFAFIDTNDPGDDPQLHATITNNQVGLGGEVNSAGDYAGVSVASFSDGAGLLEALVTGNTVTNTGEVGYEVLRGDGADEVVVRLDNNATAGADPLSGILVDSAGAPTTGGSLAATITNHTITAFSGLEIFIDDAPGTSCLDITGNTLTGDPAGDGLFLLHDSGTLTVEGNANTASPQAYLEANNTLSSAVVFTAGVQNGASIDCSTPKTR